MRLFKIPPCLAFLLLAACGGLTPQWAQSTAEKFITAAAKGDKDAALEFIGPARRNSKDYKMWGEINPFLDSRFEHDNTEMRSNTRALVTFRITTGAGEFSGKNRIHFECFFMTNRCWIEGWTTT